MVAIGKAFKQPRQVKNWVLRKAQLRDLEQLAQLEQMLFPDEAWDLETLRAEITFSDRDYVVAVDGEDESVVIGYAGIMQLGESADLHTIGTVIEGQQIGTALLNWCLARAKDRGVKELLLEVRVDNLRAIRFYERLGFSPLGVRKNYYRTPKGPVDAYVMRREL